LKKKAVYFFILLLFSVLLIDYGYLQVEEKEAGILAFITGEEYLEMPDDIFKTFYVYGLSDMYSFYNFYYNHKIYPDIRRKIKSMTIDQTKAIFDKYLEEHPEAWHFSAASTFDHAMWETMEKL